MMIGEAKNWRDKWERKPWRYPITLAFCPDREGNVTLSKDDLKAVVKLAYGTGKDDGIKGIENECINIEWKE